MRDKLQQQRKEYKEKNKRKENPGEGKRSIKKVKKGVAKLGELIGLIQSSQSGSDSTLTVSEINANAMGGRNSRQAKKDVENSNSKVNDGIATKIAKLKSELNISSLSLPVKENSTKRNTAGESPLGTVGANEADTNAECGVAGRNMIPLLHMTRSADIFGYLSSKGAVEDVPIGTSATTYTCPKTCLTYILLFHEFLWFGDRTDHSLINPNQL